MSGEPPIQFSVTRTAQNEYRVVVQSEKQIVRSYNVGVSSVLDHVAHEVEQLASQRPGYHAPDTDPA